MSHLSFVLSINCPFSLLSFYVLSYTQKPHVPAPIFFSLRSEGITRTLSMDVNEWNPFEEEEDVLFGKEFDKLRRGSNSSEYFITHFYMQCYTKQLFQH